MKVAIYARVSTEEQAKEGYSIDAQKQRLTDFARSQAWDIHDFYIDDGYSAKDLNRPNVQRMISDIKAKHFDVVLVYRLDRLVRSVMNLHELLQLFDRYEVKFKSATEMFDTTSAMGRFFITLVGAMAQWERENIGERVKMGMTQKHAEGGRNGAVAPYGYELADGELIVNPVEAEVVKRIFTLYRQNNGALAIAKRFNREGVPRRESDSTWVYNTVYYIITNPVYCGKIRWNYRKSHGNRTGEEIIVQGGHEPIISEEVFDEVQRMRQERAVDGKVTTSDYPFTGVLRCGRCGHAMVGGSRPVKNGRKRYYKCLGRFNMGKCDMPIIAEDSITASFIKIVSSDQHDISDVIIKENTPAEIDERIKLRKELKTQIEKIEKRKDKWYEAFHAEIITLGQLKEKTAEDNEREKYLRQELSKIPEIEKSVPLNELTETLNEFAIVWEKNEDYSRKQFINFLFESIIVSTDVTEAKGGPGRFVPVELKFKIKQITH